MSGKGEPGIGSVCGKVSVTRSLMARGTHGVGLPDKGISPRTTLQKILWISLYTHIVLILIMTMNLRLVECLHVVLGGSKNVLKNFVFSKGSLKRDRKFFVCVWGWGNAFKSSVTNGFQSRMVLMPEELILINKRENISTVRIFFYNLVFSTAEKPFFVSFKTYIGMADLKHTHILYSE